MPERACFLKFKPVVDAKAENGKAALL